MGCSTKIACTSLGPCTPRVSVSSMSAVRLGPEPNGRHRAHFLGSVYAARERELDVGRSARARDEVDGGASRGRSAVAVPGLEQDADLAQRFDEDRPVEDRDVAWR